MRIFGISRIDAADTPTVVRQEASAVQPLGRNYVEPVPQSGDEDTAQLIPLSKAMATSVLGVREAYAKIRYDQTAGMVLIQIINATNNEIIAEIPPGLGPN